METQQFIDADSYQGGKQEKVTFRDIVLSQVKKISDNSNKEFKGGYYDYKPINVGQFGSSVKVYVPDSREVYSNSVEYLYDLVFPHADKELIKSGEIAEKEIEEVYSKSFVFNKKRKEKLKELDGKEKEEYLKEMFRWRILDTDPQKVYFRSVQVRICRKLFREICCFLKRVDYFEGQTFEDEVK